MSRVTLVAPFAGWCVPLAQVPDPVFAEGMAGDGLAIDPVEGVLHAPCAGELVVLKDAKHAVTVRIEGIDVLIHIGIDTVELGGTGFERIAPPGKRVAAGEPLVRFDLDLLARRAKSLVSPILVVSGGRILRRAAEGRIAAGDFLLEIEAVAAGAKAEPTPPPPNVARAACTFIVPFEHGLHARPAAQLAAALRPFVSDVRFTFRGREANARSTIAMMALGVRAGDAIEAHAVGDDAGAALAVLERTFALAPVEAKPAARAAEVPGRIEGVIASRGLAVGPCTRWERPEVAVAANSAGGAQEMAALESALAAVAAHLESLHAAAQGEAQAIVAAHIELTRDPDLRARASEGMTRGESAGHAWRRATRDTASLLAALDDERMRERAADLLDLEHQVLRVLAGEAPGSVRDLPPGAIVVADELLPSQLLAIARSGVHGICTARGGATSHMAILAAAAGLPAIVAAGDGVLAIAEGTPLVLDAERGVLEIDPPEPRWNEARRALEQRHADAAADAAVAQDTATTRDGVRIAVMANLASAAEARAALAQGAEGCGLLRTEFLYLDRREAPGEDEQSRAYREIADALGGRPLTIRTMDIGGDKPIAFLPMPAEENPALGLRGVRANLEHPRLLRTQLAAILRVSSQAPCRVMVPMVTDISDIRFVRTLLDEERTRLGLAESPPLGAMIETPASALLAPQLARECDFFSLGTNDLAQYTLAIDRAHPRLAARLDALHPAVLRLMAQVAQAAREQGKSVSVCGALGSDDDALPILVGLGIHEISALPSAIPRLKRIARRLVARECRELAERALEESTATAVRALVAASRPARPTLVAGD